MLFNVRLSWTYFLSGFIFASILLNLRWASFVVVVPQQRTRPLLLQQFVTNSTSNDTAVQNDDASIVDVDDNNSFSACLLIMDGNHRLPEWLAYHYYVLNLRYLVVAVDPSSRTSPAFILKRWNGRIKVVQWSDANFTSRHLTRREGDSEKKILDLHRTRQWVFYNACSRHLKEHGRRWTIYIDTDEFLSINEALIPDAQERIRHPGSIPKFLNQLRSDTTGQYPRSDFYQQNRSCYTIPRRLYSAVESSKEKINQGVPQSFNPLDFDTLRYRFRAEKAAMRTGYCKSMVNVAAVPDELLKYDEIAGTTHRPFKSLCPSQYVEYVFPIGIHHYLGSLEAFLFRDDARKNHVKTDTAWKKRAFRKIGGPDDEVRPWLEGFVEYVGKEQAKALLHGAGVLNHSDTDSTLGRY